ncbi:MAG: 8-oxo-dGTP diphosphatase [Gammaproteobacteria bacterium]
MIKQFRDIDWNSWQPTEKATLMFVIDNDEVLLIRKKRGLGAGKINGPGGRLEAGETIEQCAVRETQEELGVTAIKPMLQGRHKFQFSDGYALEVFVYCTTEYSGNAIETEEAIPLWTPINAIPYEEMWEDDRIWLPKMFAGQFFDGRYLFDKDKMLGYELDHISSTDHLLDSH